ncbi:MAG: undecaprenyldiphospho-muramoylpentapeptide beta-N-acetylglucosaminyltransferase [Massiliimalia sp.]|jgi:UDP-N-acetylglucosamine--N-acetylmuramyl-(pentapeptide) pyrophosphoryl-undecaprenol N-acetylglucosamine transferase
MMKVLLAGGGTAGHINPAIAIAQYIRSKNPDAKILFAGTPKGMEADLVKKAGFDFTPIKVGGFRRSFSVENVIHNMQSLYYLATSDFAAKRIVRDFQPDLVIGTGGYVSGPVVLAASKAGIKTAIHEQNAFPGVTNKILAKRVNRVYLAVEEAKQHLDPAARCVVVGNPIRQTILKTDAAAARKELGLDDRMCVLSFGGSLGAAVINRMAADLMEWNGTQHKINHIHGYGRQGKELFPQLLQERNLKLEDLPGVSAREYIDNMATCLAAADLVICRSGAMTLSELEATGKPSILVPSPYVAENHQYHNAMVLVNHQAACLIQEKEYDKKVLFQQIEDFYQHPEKLRQYGENAKKLAILDTAKRIYEDLMTL